MLSVNKIGYTNTLELVGRVADYIERKNAVLAGSGLQLVLADDQTVATREALGIMQSNAIVGLLLVLATCWLFLGSRISALVALGVVFSVMGTFVLLDAVGFTLNVSVLLGIVIVLGMLVDDAVVLVEAMYFRMERGMAALTPRWIPSAKSAAGAGGGIHHHCRLPAADAVAGDRRQVHVRHPLRGDGGAHGEPDRSLLDAAGPRRGPGRARHQPLAHPGPAGEVDPPAAGHATRGC